MAPIYSFEKKNLPFCSPPIRNHGGGKQVLRPSKSATSHPYDRKRPLPYHVLISSSEIGLNLYNDVPLPYYNKLTNNTNKHILNLWTSANETCTDPSIDPQRPLIPFLVKNIPPEHNSQTPRSSTKGFNSTTSCIQFINADPYASENSKMRLYFQQLPSYLLLHFYGYFSPPTPE